MAVVWTYSWRGFGLLSMKDANSEAVAAAERALSLDPGCVAALVALFVNENFWGWNWPRALEVAEQALYIAPDDADVFIADVVSRAPGAHVDAGANGRAARPTQCRGPCLRRSRA